MSTIRDIHNPWRDRYQTAKFRGAFFHVEMAARSSGRRTALHEYPKRNEPYAEDMGRAARRFSITGYLIGPNYLRLRDLLIEALEQDGPGSLRLPLPYLGEDIEAMCVRYTVTETRERGGLCGIEMDFVEYGKPGFAVTAVQTVADLENAAKGLEDTVTK